MWEWIQTWTFFNWLTVIAFLFFPLSALNAIFSLRTRYKDWRATTSKKSFEKRLKELKNRFETIKEYRESTILIIELIDESMPSIFLFVSALGMILISAYAYFGYSEHASWGKTIAAITLLIAQTFISMSSILITKLAGLVKHIRYPLSLAKEIIELIHDGKAKNLTTGDEDTLIDSLVNGGLFNEDGRKILLEYKDNYKKSNT